MYQCSRCGKAHDARAVNDRHSIEIDVESLCVDGYASRFGRRRMRVVTKQMERVCTPTKAQQRRVDAEVARLP